jgi:hypothetical protein
MGHKYGLAGNGTLACTKELAEKAIVGSGPVTHLGFKGYAVVHVVHRPGLGNHSFAGIKLYLDNLDIIADNLIINFMGLYGLIPLYFQ